MKINYQMNIGCAIEVHKRLDHGYRIDLLAEEKVVIEIKTVEDFTDVHLAQVQTYLRLRNDKHGLLLNFHTTVLKNGIKKIIN